MMYGNTAEYEAYLTNPLEDRYPEEPEVRCDWCGEPCSVYVWWCGECGCCKEHCQNFINCEGTAPTRGASN